MKKFFRNLVLLALLLAVGFLGWRTSQLHRDNQILRETVQQLEQERRDLHQRAATAQRAPKPEEQASLRSRIEEQTSELRGLPFKHPVNYKMIARDELRDVLVEKVKEQYTEQELHDYSRTLETLGLVPAGTDLMNIIVSLYDEQVAAFYVPEERSLYTFKDMAWTSGLDKMLLSHELTHALQDQTFDLTTFPLKLKENDDLVLATAALIEGDATVLMTRWYVENIDPSNLLTDLGAAFGQNTAKLREAPLYLREMLLFPYQQGQRFAMTLFLAGGNEALDEAFRNPPRSTKEILHPELYTGKRAHPEQIALPPIESPDWRLIGNSVLGEFGVRCLLEQHIGSYQAHLVAQGWNGDRFNVYERGPMGPTGLVWVTAWENADAAGEFEETYSKIIPKLAPSYTARIQRDGNRVTILQASDPSFYGVASVASAR